MTDASLTRYKRHRFPTEIVAHAVWLYYRFPLSLRGVEDLLAERGIDVSFPTVSEWAAKLGCEFAHQLRRRSRSHFADKWHLDEMVVSIKGKKYWLWRAVDANGYVLDALVQSRRNKKAALRLIRKLLKSHASVIARKKGVCIYVGDGHNRWPAAHVLNVARLYGLAIVKAEPSAKYHAVAEGRRAGNRR